ncbi:hypothetical protein JQ609_26600 [Bradyrhizobium sp. AUGA SZCCT0169]|uniref:hypothetical protein n=1 Tax=Bradyrhizobium sp. AUGA SZCCT0169 TaxID=2807663 RepID=UPI001BA47421|nr:hypothetical protein [Bradyrhizobium sp. AUGA SZCCT0169]MBR1250477.1 hypothetical protein [Bradyrhizobium sp. AUGA SZCCT0169]
MSVRRLLTLLMLFFLTFSLAQAQTAMNELISPSIKVLGFYSPSAASDRYSRFIQQEIASHDPANFPEDQKILLRKLGRGDALQPFTEDDRREWEKHLRRHMDDATVIEVLVSNPSATSDIGGFVQPDPSQPESTWQVAWNEKFLTADGEHLLEVRRGKKLPDVPQFRVVFVIHSWKQNLPLRSSDGELSLPPIQPLPERLWRLAPYQMPG